MSRYEEFEAFVRTVEAGSFTAAAAQLRVAKSAISRRISELEQRLGVQLIVRSTRSLKLSDAGDTLFLQAKRLLEDWQEAESATQDHQSGLTGAIRLAAPLSFGVEHLNPLLLAFQKQHSKIVFDIDFSDRPVDLIADGFDLVIRIGQLKDSANIARKLAIVRMVVAASETYLNQRRMPSIPADLSELDELRYTNRSLKGWSFTGPDGQVDIVNMNAALRATSGEFLRDAAIAGLGVTIQPAFILHKALKSGELVELLPDYKLPDLGIYALYPASRHLPQRVRVLIDKLTAQCGNNPYWNDW